MDAYFCGYRALAYQGYNVAMNLVKMVVADPSHQRKPLAIVLDADETSRQYKTDG